MRESGSLFIEQERNAPSMVWEMGKVMVGRPVILQRLHRYERSVRNISTIILLSSAR